MVSFGHAFAVGMGVLAIGACSPKAESEPGEALGATSIAGGAPADTKPVGEGPFGLTLGMKIEDVGGARPLEKPGFYEVAAPPKPHPDFESVVLIAYPETGICLVRGIGRTIEGDGSGGQIRAKVDGLAAALSTKYGKSAKLDDCSGGDIQCSNEFWMMTLDGGDRAYVYKWTAQNPLMKKNRIGEIYVAASAGNIQASYPMIEFHSEDRTGCTAAERAASASSL
jgi:hypothetical protein